MPNWSDLHAFLAIARSGGLSPAARITGRSPATLGRRMQLLERDLNCVLFARHDRGYDLTAEGRALFADLQEVDARLSRITAQERSDILPTVRLSAGTWTTLHLTSHLSDLQGTTPDLRVRFVSAEAVLNIAHREVTIGIRNARPTEPGLAARRMGDVNFAPYAVDNAPDLWIRHVADTPSAIWLTKHSSIDIAAEVTAPRNALDLALNGHGKVLLPTFIGNAEKRLRRLAPPIPELTQGQWIVAHDDDRHLPEVRRTLDRLYRLFEVT